MRRRSIKKIVVLGASGMLGSMLVDYLSAYYSVVATVRREQYIKPMRNVEWKILRAPNFNHSLLNGCDWVINAIGAIPQRGYKYQSANVMFPNLLAFKATLAGIQVLQIATDCVYSGNQGHYDEDSKYDPVDDYGVSKMIGEVHSPCVNHLRCSIIGIEPYGHFSLLSWFRGLPQGALIAGYTNQYWNGITTLHFARICTGMIENNNLVLPMIQHIVPADAVTKYTLLKYCQEYFGRSDVVIEPGRNRHAVDRRLTTNNPNLNQTLWKQAGYDAIPTIRQMVKELAEYESNVVETIEVNRGLVAKAFPSPLQ